MIGQRRHLRARRARRRHPGLSHNGHHGRHHRGRPVGSGLNGHTPRLRLPVSVNVVQTIERTDVTGILHAVLVRIRLDYPRWLGRSSSLQTPSRSGSVIPLNATVAGISESISISIKLLTGKASSDSQRVGSCQCRYKSHRHRGHLSGQNRRNHICPRCHPHRGQLTFIGIGGQLSTSAHKPSRSASLADRDNKRQASPTSSPSVSSAGCFQYWAVVHGAADHHRVERIRHWSQASRPSISIHSHWRRPTVICGRTTHHRPRHLRHEGQHHRDHLNHRHAIRPAFGVSGTTDFTTTSLSRSTHIADGGHHLYSAEKDSHQRQLSSPFGMSSPSASSSQRFQCRPGQHRPGLRYWHQRFSSHTISIFIGIAEISMELHRGRQQRIQRTLISPRNTTIVVDVIAVADAIAVVSSSRVGTSGQLSAASRTSPSSSGSQRCRVVISSSWLGQALGGIGRSTLMPSPSMSSLELRDTISLRLCSHPAKG